MVLMPSGHSEGTNQTALELTEKAQIRLRERAVWSGPSLFVDIFFNSHGLFNQRYKGDNQTALLIRAFVSRMLGKGRFFILREIRSIERKRLLYSVLRRWTVCLSGPIRVYAGSKYILQDAMLCIEICNSWCECSNAQAIEAQICQEIC